MNTQEKQNSNVPTNEISKNQILNMDDDFLNSDDPDEDEEDEDDEEEDVDDEDLEEEAENSVDNPGNDFNEIEKEIDEDIE